MPQLTPFWKMLRTMKTMKWWLIRKGNPENLSDTWGLGGHVERRVLSATVEAK
jgi:hypothetical protein